jgi:hypothetical protein
MAFFMHFIKHIRKQHALGQLDRFIGHRHFNVQKSNRKKTITINCLVLIYGNAATQKIAQQIAKNIAWHWNYPKAKVKIRGNLFKVIFNIKGQYFPSVKANIIRKNRDQKIFFIRIEHDVANVGVSLMDGICSNTGFFKISNVAYKGATTEAHEFGHALGLWPGTADGHPSDTDQRGKGVPGIMYARGSWVDARYQYDPSKMAGEPGGTVNPDYRRVRQLDIDMLGLAQKNWNQKGKIRLGKLTSKFHEDEYQ